MGWCMGGAWCGACVVHVVVVNMCVLPGLVRLDLGVGGGLDGDGEEVVGAVSMENIYPINIFNAPNVANLEF